MEIMETENEDFETKGKHSREWSILCIAFVFEKVPLYGYTTHVGLLRL